MKTLKFALIAVLVACTMVSLSYADGKKEKPKPLKVVNITLENAMQIPGLVAAMYTQIDKDDFMNGAQHIYVAEVVYLGSLYRISGTFDQWMKFFRLQGVLPISIKYPALSDN